MLSPQPWVTATPPPPHLCAFQAQVVAAAAPLTSASMALSSEPFFLYFFPCLSLSVQAGSASTGIRFSKTMLVFHGCCREPYHKTGEFSTGLAWKTPSLLLTSTEMVDWPTHFHECLSSYTFGPVSEHTMWEAEHFPVHQVLVPFGLAVPSSIDLFPLTFYYKQHGESKLHSTLFLEFFSVKYPRSSLASFISHPTDKFS